MGHKLNTKRIDLQTFCEIVGPYAGSTSFGTNYSMLFPICPLGYLALELLLNGLVGEDKRGTMKRLRCDLELVTEDPVQAAFVLVAVSNDYLPATNYGSSLAGAEEIKTFMAGAISSNWGAVYGPLCYSRLNGGNYRTKVWFNYTPSKMVQTRGEILSSDEHQSAAGARTSLCLVIQRAVATNRTDNLTIANRVQVDYQVRGASLNFFKE